MNNHRFAIMCLSIAYIATTVVIYVALATATEPGDINARSTRQYLINEHQALQLFAADLPLAQLNVDHIVHQIRQGCPQSALEAPSDERVLQGIVLLVIASIEKTETGVMGKFLHTVERLKWNSRVIVHAISVMQRTFSSQTAIVVPNLCTDIGLWRSTGFRELPRSMTEFIRRAAEVSAIPVHGLRLLVRYERVDENDLVLTIERLKRLVDYDVAAIVTRATRQIRNIIGLRMEGPEANLPSIEAPTAVKLVGGRELHEFEVGAQVAVQSGCLACHRIGDQGNRRPGPELTYIGARLDESQIRRALISPFPPMPSFKNMPKAKLHALIRFLRLLK
jgi:hypothetical protein